MLRRVSILTLAVAMLAAAGGCRHRCGSGWFTSGVRTEAPCRLTGSGDGCIDGIPVGGGALPPGVPGGVVPGGGYAVPGGGSPTELPLPQPNGLIPPQGIPFAPPSPAPGDGGASILPAPKGGVPVGR